MFCALQTIPPRPPQYIDAHPDCKLEGGNSHAFMYHWIYTLKNLGLNDAGVTADYPIHNVFRKDGEKTYVVYNYSGQPLSVKFSDGKVLRAKGRGMTIEPSMSGPLSLRERASVRSPLPPGEG